MTNSDYEFSNASEEYLESLARAKDCDVLYPRDNELFIDIDTIEDMQKFNKGLEFFEKNEIHVTLTMYKSRNKPQGMHIIVRMDWDLDDIERVAWQACLGSDQTREMIACMRYKNNAQVVSCFFEPRLMVTK